jgi:hypothetical protein
VISQIKRKITGEEMEKENQLSLPSKAFQLFLERKTLVEVAIKLDISKDETIKMYSDFLALHNMGKVAAILIEHLNSLPVFLKWFNYIKQNRIRKSDVTKAIENVKLIDALNQKKENLKKEVQIIHEEWDKSLRNYEYINREIKNELN